MVCFFNKKERIFGSLLFFLIRQFVFSQVVQLAIMVGFVCVQS